MQLKALPIPLKKNSDSDNLGTLVDDISINNDICIEILSKDGDVLYSSHVIKNCVIPNMSSFEKSELLDYFDRNSTFTSNGNANGQIPDFILNSPGFEYFDANGTFAPHGSQAIPDPASREPLPEKNHQESIIYSKILADKADSGGMVVINSLISPLNATVNTLRVQLYFITSFMLLFAVILAFIITKRILNPIIALNNNAKMLATGDYETNFDAADTKKSVSFLTL